MTLQVLIATHQPQGIERVAAMGLPRVPGVSYVVSWQQHGGAPVPASLTGRGDVEVWRLERGGVSANRNNAIDHATADILLMADDDLVYTSGQLEAVMRTFEDNPGLDYASFRYEGGGKSYPGAECGLAELPRGFYQTTFEVAVRRGAGLRFNEEFGPGAPYLGAAEDEMFLLTARRKGLDCRFFPITVARHPGLTTGNRPVTNPAVTRAYGAFIALSWPLTCLPRIALKAWRLWRGGQSALVPALWHQLCGAAYAARRVKIR